MKKSYYKLFLDILTEIFESPKDLDETTLIEKFGQEEYTMFSRYFIGNPGRYVHKDLDRNALGLTNEGLEFYLKLRQDYNNQLQSKLTLRTTMGAVILVLTGFLMDKWKPEIFTNQIHKIAYWGVVSFLTIFGAILILNAVADYFKLKD